MFTMMNNARLKVGLEGVGLAEGAYQQALAYARERVQGQSPVKPGPVTIINHPDVRRMLLLMKSQTEAMRALAYTTAASMDIAERSTDAALCARHQARVDLMVPIVKAWCTEQAQEVCSLGIQIHGGMGYIEETGAAPYFRDARITTIYEGTTGIQSQDLAGRKIIRDEGQAATALCDDMLATASALAAAGMTDMAAELRSAVESVQNGVTWLLANYADDVHAPNAVCYNLLMLTGTVAGAWQLARGALAAAQQLAGSDTDADYFRARQQVARFYFAHVLPRARAHLHAVRAGSDAVMALAEDDF